MVNIEKWLQKIDKNTEQFFNAFSEINAAQLNWKPNPGKWSIGQCIDHIIVTNATYFPVLQEIIENRYHEGFLHKMPILPGFFGKMLLSGVRPDGKRKMKTFPVFEPASSNFGLDLLDKFRKHQEQLKDYISKIPADKYEKLVITSPASKFIVYSLKNAIEIIIAHEQRHFEQAKNVLIHQSTTVSI